MSSSSSPDERAAPHLDAGDLDAVEALDVEGPPGETLTEGALGSRGGGGHRRGWVTAAWAAPGTLWLLFFLLAPIVMSYLGQKKQQQNIGADGLGGLLGGLLGDGQAAAAPSSGNPMIDMATSALDRDGDGSSLDDIASMAFNYINKR